MSAWLLHIQSEKNDSADDVPLDWIKPMTRSDPAERIKASALVELIHNDSHNLQDPGLFIASCCTSTSTVSTGSPDLRELGDTGLGITKSQSSSRNNSDFVVQRKRIPSASEVRSASLDSQSGLDKRPNRSRSPNTQNFARYENAETIRLPLEPTRSPGSASSRPFRDSGSASVNGWTSSLRSSPLPDELSLTTVPSQKPPVPPAGRGYELKCMCGPRSDEKHIFNSAYSSSAPARFDPENRTMEIFSMCELGENRIQIYESVPLDPRSLATNPKLWCVTRRLVISYVSGDPAMRHCNSLWVPLADLRFAMTGNILKVSWSDCNQMRERSFENYQRDYNWIYDANRPNNAVEIPFNSVEEAQDFIATVTLPYTDNEYITHTKHISASDSTKIDIFDASRPDVQSYRAIAVKEASTLGLCTSKLYIFWPEIDLQIANTYARDPNVAYEMQVELKNINTPTYISDTLGEPAPDDEIKARFSQARQIRTSMTVRFPVLPHYPRFPTPPPCMYPVLSLKQTSICADHQIQLPSTC